MTGRDLFNRIDKGMTFEEVVQILGDEGEIVSGHAAQIEPGLPIGVMNTQIRQWTGEDGSVIRVMFGGGKVREKTMLPGSAR